MQKWNKVSRVLLLLALLIGMAVIFFAPASVNQPVRAAPQVAVVAGDVVISEFRTTGSGGASDEFIELHNLTNNSINITGLKIMGSSSAGSTATRATIGSVTLSAGQYYLLVNTGASASLLALANATYPSGITDDGGIAILDGATIIDQVGMSSGSAYKEGTPLTSLPGSTDESYERIGSGCSDSGNNSADFYLRDPSSPQNMSSSAVVCADLSLVIGVSNAAPNVGDSVTFTLTMTNLGRGDATGISVKEIFPIAGLTYQSSIASSGSYNDLTGFWTISTLTSGSIATLTVNASVTTTGVKTNRVEIWTVDQFDPDSTPGNGITNEDDYDLVQVIPLGSPALNITNAVNNPNPNVGANIIFTITVHNPLGNLYNATNTQVAALLPAGLTYVSHASTVGTYNSGSGIWTIGTLAIGASATINITAKVITSNPPPYSATVSSDEYIDSTATETINNPLPGEADLVLTQSLGTNTSIAGNVILTITLTNNGPDTATGVDVKDLLPSGLTFVSYTSTSGSTYTSSTGIWTIDNIPNTSSSSLNITVKAASSGTSTNNFAEVWQSNAFDPDSTPGNGENGEDDNASLEVPVVDLTLSQTVDLTPGTAIFTIKVSNTGPDDATGLKVKISLPSLTSTYTYVSSGSTQGSYDNNSGVWTVGSLADGANATLIITTTTTGSLVVNQAEVYQVDQVDPDSVPNNNSKTEDDDASAPLADLFVTQSVNNNNPDINTNVVFTITVTNLGAGGTTNVEVKDILPAGLTYVSYTSTSGTTYSNSTGIWTVGTLAAGARKILSITAKVETPGIKTNWAEVWKSDDADPDSTPGNSSTTEDDDASATITSFRSIIINEVAWAGTATALENDEWIELYNPSSTSINITGWILKSTSGSVNITLSGTIPSGAFFLLERDDNLTVSDITADQIYTGVLSDSGEILTLSDGSSNFIDTANGNGGAWPAGSSSTFGSMERTSAAAESDSIWATNTGVKKNGKTASNGNILGTPKNSNSSGTSSSGTAVPTVTPTATPVPPTIVIDPRPIINEILARPGFDWNQDGRADVFDEFIEIKNLTAVDINLEGWVLDDGEKTGSSPFTIPDTVLKPGQRIVFYALQTNILLSDGGDTVRLINANEKIYDAYTYSIAKVEDRSICRLPDGNITGSWFEDCIPTPNLTNTREGIVPSMPQEGYESPVCDLPDTIPSDFFIAECHGYGANVWNSFYWDEDGWLGEQTIPQNMSKWEAFIK